jgi:hypothetical protein
MIDKDINFTAMCIEPAIFKNDYGYDFGVAQVIEGKIKYTNRWLLNTQTKTKKINRDDHYQPWLYPYTYSFDKVWDEIRMYFFDTIIIGHSLIENQMPIIQRLYDQYNIQTPFSNQGIDIKNVFKREFDIDTNDIKSICKFFEIESSSWGTEETAILCAKSMLHLIEKYDYQFK